MSSRTAKWLGGAVVVVVALLVVLLNWSNWNWLRGPISRSVEDKTGRQLVIGGDLIMHLGWPRTHISTQNLRFANPTWAHTPDMVAVQNIGLDISMPSLLRGAIVFTQVHLDKANVALEISPDGRKNWLLDRMQKDEKSRLQIQAITVNEGQLSFRELAKKTDIAARLATQRTASANAVLAFEARGKYLGQPLKAQGVGGSLLLLREEGSSYPLNAQATIGPTTIQAEGRVTNLLKFAAINLLIDLRGENLAHLYPIIGVVLPDSPPYHSKGRLIRHNKTWRYQKFTGQIGKSDIAGNISIVTGGKRPLLTGSVTSNRLNFADLGPLVGAQKNQVAKAKTEGKGVLPTTPFRTGRWGKMDADITLKATSIVRDEALPINNLATHLLLRDAILTLDPLQFGIAGGTLAGTVKLDARTATIQASTNLKARKIKLAELFPTFKLAKTTVGLVNGDIQLKGRGNSIATMLGSADGQLAMVVNRGEISKLMMEAVGLHLLEMLQLSLSGDKNIQIHCGIADFNVRQGVMQANLIVLDTDITRLNISGNIDLGKEQLDLTLVQKSKKWSLIALRPPIHIRGKLAKPDISLDKGKLAARGLGAIALAAINPILALLPLVETGKDLDSSCGQLLKDSNIPVQKATRALSAR